MHHRAQLRLAALLVLAVLTLAPSAAAASLYSNILRSFATSQMVPPCAYSSRQLESVLKSEGPNGGQYDEPLITAIRNALAARADGACPSKETAAAAAAAARAAARRAPAGGPTSFASASRSIPVLPVTAATSARLPGPIVLMAALAGLLALLAGVLGVARMRGWDPVWAVGWRHAWSEAGYRFAGAWTELVDRLRSRRSR